MEYLDGETLRIRLSAVPFIARGDVTDRARGRGRRSPPRTASASCTRSQAADIILPDRRRSSSTSASQGGGALDGGGASVASEGTIRARCSHGWTERLEGETVDAGTISSRFVPSSTRCWLEKERSSRKPALDCRDHARRAGADDHDQAADAAAPLDRICPRVWTRTETIDGRNPPRPAP